MKFIFSKAFISGFIFLLLVSSVNAQKKSGLTTVLEDSYNLVPQHSADTQYYEMQSTLQKHSPDGAIIGTDIYRLSLRCIPAKNNSQKSRYTCLKFTVQVNDATPVSIPSLSNWDWYFAIGANNRDTSEQLFGIDHKVFENLKGEDGKALAIENQYHVYNAFIDFHTMDVFAEKTTGDSGIQKLKKIGDKIIHQASYSQPPVNLGAEVQTGSYFKNGEITLFFKGLGMVNKKDCAIIEYDSGNSSFFMMIKPMPTMEVPTRGSSHYWGDIYKDLRSGWIQKAVLHELVVSETTVPPSNKVHSVIERTIIIQNIHRGD